jgi:hypothetical protein
VTLIPLSQGAFNITNIRLRNPLLANFPARHYKGTVKIHDDQDDNIATFVVTMDGRDSKEKYRGPRTN